MVRRFVPIWILACSVLPGLCAESVVESSPGADAHLDPYVSIASVGSVLTVASADKVFLFTIDPEADPYVTQTGELLLDSSHGRIESLVSAGDLLLVCHRAAITLVEAPSAETARVVGSITLRGPLKGVARIGSYLYAACLPSELAVIDISTRQSPRTVVTVPTTSRPAGVMATGTTVLVSTITGTTAILDVSKPHVPAGAGLVTKVAPVVSPSPGIVYAWSRRPGRAPGGVLFNVANPKRLTRLPVSDMGSPTAACIAETRVYWADKEGRVAIIESLEPPALVGHINLGMPLAELVPCQGMLCGLTLEDRSILIFDPTVFEPFSADSAGEQTAQRSSRERGSLTLRGPLWGTRFGPGARSADARRARIPSIPPPSEQVQAAQPGPPSMRARISPDSGRKIERKIGRKRLRLGLNPFSKQMPPHGRLGPGGELVEPRLRRVIIDNRGRIVPEYERRKRVKSEQP